MPPAGTGKGKVYWTYGTTWEDELNRDVKHGKYGLRSCVGHNTQRPETWVVKPEP